MATIAPSQRSDGRDVPLLTAQLDVLAEPATVDVPRRFQLLRDTDPDRTETLDALTERLRRRREQILARDQRRAPRPDLHPSRGRGDDFGLSL
jgi:hypothetical protein